MKQKNGFALVELLVVSAIMVIFTSIVLWRYNTGNRQYLLELSVQKTMNDLRRAQNMAISSQNFQGAAPIGGYGIYFNSTYDYYILYADVDGDGIYDAGEKVEDIKLDAQVKIASLSNNPLNIVFMPPQPTTRITGGGNGVINLQIKSGGPIKAVTVFASGLIEL